MFCPHAHDEDILQIPLANDIVIDVGWYPSSDTNGNFRVVVVNSFDWLVNLHEPFETKDAMEVLHRLQYLMYVFNSRGVEW